MPDNSLQSLTIYLLKPDLEHEQIIKDIGRRIYQYFDIDGYRYHVYGKRRHDHPPAWIPFFEGRLVNGMYWQSDSPGIVLLLQVDEYMYALAFGQGRHLLSPDCFEDQFGLRVVLNSVRKIKSLEKKTFNEIYGHTITQSAFDAEVGLFGFDVEKDLLRAVTGKLEEFRLGERMSGVDSLSTSVRTELSDLPSLLRQYQTQTGLETYKENGFGFVDHMRSITSKSMKDDLNNILIECLNNRAEQIRRNILEPFDFELIIPDVLDFSRTIQFSYTESSKSMPFRHDVNINSFVEYKARGNNAITFQNLENSLVYAFTADGTKTHSWRAYKCLIGEIEKDGYKYVLNDGNWYQIGLDFAYALDRFIENIPPYEFEFPRYAGGDEAAYNETIANNVRGFVNFDRKLLHPVKGQRVEFCDLYTENYGYMDAIHVKHGTSSAVLSHLFSQGTTSAEICTSYPQTWLEAEKMIEEKIEHLSHPGEKRPYRLRTIFAIIRRNRGTLPFFSKVNLRRACKDLNLANRLFAVAQIEYDPEFLVIRH